VTGLTKWQSEADAVLANVKLKSTGNSNYYQEDMFTGHNRATLELINNNLLRMPSGLRETTVTQQSIIINNKNPINFSLQSNLDGIDGIEHGQVLFGTIKLTTLEF
jgi:hypothetical protein